jgi:tetratricopeptide (TPR) repeat protein
MDPSQISHYRLGRLLGRGGMGEVYEAEDLDLGRHVALKFIAPELAADPDNLKRFEREARSAAALNHPHIATLYAFERDGNRPFIAMELVAGESLRARIRRRGALPIEEAVAVARDVAGALATAHRRGIVHRDIKPENLMFDEDGRVKVMDFGLARATLASQLTMTGTTMGTAGYMAPESLRGSPGPPSDVFALGVVLHEMLTGTLPFAGESALALMFTITNEPPKSVRATRPEVSEALEELVGRLLDKSATTRPEAPVAARELAALAGTAPPAGAESGFGTASEANPVALPSGAHTMVLPRPSGAGAQRLTPGSGPRGAMIPAGGTEELTVEHLARVGGALEPVQVQALVAHEKRKARANLFRGVGFAFAAILIAALGTREIASRRQHASEAVMFNNLGQNAFLADSLSRARDLFGRALEREANFTPALLNLGQLYRREANLDSAALMFSRVLKTNARDHASSALAAYGLAQIDMQSGTLDGARENLARALALDSTRVEYYNDLGWTLATSGHATDAMRVLDLGLARFPDSPQLRKNKALALRRSGEPEKALALLGEVTRSAPEYASAWGLSSMLHRQLGDAAAARAAWDAYVKLEPDSTERTAFERERATTAR